MTTCFLSELEKDVHFTRIVSLVFVIDLKAQTDNAVLASCPGGAATAHGVGMTKLYVIYMER